MVVTKHFHDVFDASCKITTLSLPAYKENCLRIEFHNEEFQTVYSGQNPPLPFAQSEVFNAEIVDWRQLTAINCDCKAVYEVTFDIEGSNYTYKAGDTIGIIPQNSDVEVEAIIAHLNIGNQVDVPYTLSVDGTRKGAKIPAHVPVKSTLRHVLKNCIDLRSIIKKLFILALSRYTKDENERKILEYLCSKEGSTAYHTHIINNGLCILDIFTKFKSCKPPIEVILAHLPRLLPRPYSIANSSLKDPNILKICFSVKETGNNRKGLTTGWLEEILNRELSIEDRIQNLRITDETGVKIPIYMRKNMSGFSLPNDLETPMLLLGAGTGVSPFIGFLEEIDCIRNKDFKRNIGDIWLLFGCRNPELDFIYEKELNSFVDKGIIRRLVTAFSRIENNGVKYVQDALIQNGAEITKLIEDGAKIFVCGDLKTMASQVKESFIECIMKHSGKCRDEAEKYLQDMEMEKRYCVDIWT